MLTRVTKTTIIVWTALVVGLAVAVSFVGRQIESDRARQAAAAAIRDAFADGFPLTYSDLVRPTTSEDRRQVQDLLALNLHSGRVLHRSDLAYGWLPPLALGVARCRWMDDSDGAAFTAFLESDAPELDRAVEILLSGAQLISPPEPIGRFPNLSRLNSLATALRIRASAHLRAGESAEAWRVLSALTALATRFEPEPSEPAHLAHSEIVRQAYVATWEALRTNAWTTTQLDELSQRWHGVNFLRSVADIPAYSAVALRQLVAQTRDQFRTNSPVRLSRLVQTLRSRPLDFGSELVNVFKRASQQRHYCRIGSYQDEVALLTHGRRRRTELRRAISEPDWRAMMALPGVTNATPLNLSEDSILRTTLVGLGTFNPFILGIDRNDSLGLSAAVESEALRRVLIAALAVEIYRENNGSLPDSLSTVPGVMPDFISGESLRYQRVAGSFVLYSLGLNGTDDGGALVPQKVMGASSKPRPDLVWPRHATREEVMADEVRREAELPRLSPSTVRGIRK